MLNVKTPLSIKINGKLCKKCGLCSAFCPQGVLAPLKTGFPKIVNLQNCVVCRACEFRCPDFAITVEVNDNDCR